MMKNLSWNLYDEKSTMGKYQGKKMIENDHEMIEIDHFHFFGDIIL